MATFDNVILRPVGIEHQIKFNAKAIYRISIISFLCAWPAFGQQPQSHSCTPALESQRTTWGNMTVRMNLSKPARALTGIVSIGSAVNIEPAEGVLVEIFPARKDDTDWLPRDPETTRPRLYACFTGAHGAFDFDVPSGLYYLIASKQDFKATLALVSINRKHGKRKAFTIPLEVGT